MILVIVILIKLVTERSLPVWRHLLFMFLHAVIDFLTHLRLYKMYLTYTTPAFSCAEILVLGTGSRLERINPSVLALLRSKGIAVEVQDTVKCSQYISVTLSVSPYKQLEMP